MIKDNILPKILDKKIIGGVPLVLEMGIIEYGSLGMSPREQRKFNEIYYDGFLKEAMSNPIYESNAISLDSFSYSEWNRMRLFFKGALAANELETEFALGLAKYLTKTRVTIYKVEDYIKMQEQLVELRGIICTLEEQALGLK